MSPTFFFVLATNIGITLADFVGQQNRTNNVADVCRRHKNVGEILGDICRRQKFSSAIFVADNLLMQ